jgi:hypothetical protein
MPKIRFERWRKKADADDVRSDFQIQQTKNMPSSSSGDRPPLFFAHVSVDVSSEAGNRNTKHFKKSRPENVRFIEQMVRDYRGKKQQRKIPRSKEPETGQSGKGRSPQ